VDGGTVDHVGTFFRAADGARSVDLSGSSGGVISQPLTPGNAGPAIDDVRVTAR
jgi:hypothetical protein